MASFDKGLDDFLDWFSSPGIGPSFLFSKILGVFPRLLVHLFYYSKEIRIIPKGTSPFFLLL